MRASSPLLVAPALAAAVACAHGAPTPPAPERLGRHEAGLHPRDLPGGVYGAAPPVPAALPPVCPPAAPAAPRGACAGPSKEKALAAIPGAEDASDAVVGCLAAPGGDWTVVGLTAEVGDDLRHTTYLVPANGPPRALPGLLFGATDLEADSEPSNADSEGATSADFDGDGRTDALFRAPEDDRGGVVVQTVELRLSDGGPPIRAALPVPAGLSLSVVPVAAGRDGPARAGIAFFVPGVGVGKAHTPAFAADEAVAFSVRGPRLLPDPGLAQALYDVSQPARACAACANTTEPDPSRCAPAPRAPHAPLAPVPLNVEPVDGPRAVPEPFVAAEPCAAPTEDDEAQLAPLGPLLAARFAARGTRHDGAVAVTGCRIGPELLAVVAADGYQHLYAIGRAGPPTLLEWGGATLTQGVLLGAADLDGDGAREALWSRGALGVGKGRLYQRAPGRPLTLVPHAAEAVAVTVGAEAGVLAADRPLYEAVEEPGMPHLRILRGGPALRAALVKAQALSRADAGL